MAKKKTTKKTTSKKKTAKKAPAKKKASKKKKTSVQKKKVETPVQAAPVVNAIDHLWEEVRKLPINVFAIPHHQVEQYFRRVRGVPGALCLVPTVSAALPALETTLQSIEQETFQRTAEGDPVRVMLPKYEMTNTEGSFIMIKRYVPKSQRPELQPVTFNT